MRPLLASKPVLWFLFLVNFAAAAVAPFVIDNLKGLLASIGMSLVSLGAGVTLLRGGGQRRRPLPLARPHLEVVRDPAGAPAGAASGSQWTKQSATTRRRSGARRDAAS